MSDSWLLLPLSCAQKQAAHPGFHKMIVEAIAALADRSGSSIPGIWASAVLCCALKNVRWKNGLDWHSSQAHGCVADLAASNVAIGSL
jgi:hypothetical protein